jgi:hypothetical protein
VASSESFFAWLIERGQSVHHVPTVWRIAGPHDEVGLRDGEQWTQDAWEATRYATQAEADAVIERLLTNPKGPTARAVEHGFVEAARG